MPKIEMRVSEQAQAEADALLKIADRTGVPVEELVSHPNIIQMLNEMTKASMGVNAKITIQLPFMERDIAKAAEGLSLISDIARNGDDLEDGEEEAFDYGHTIISYLISELRKATP